MKRTVVASSFVLIAGLIGAAAAFIFLGDDRDPDAPLPIAVAASHRHIISQYRVAVRFPDRFEFESERDGEVRYYDQKTTTRLIFIVTALNSATFDDVVTPWERIMMRQGEVERLERVSETRVEATVVSLFRLVFQALIFEGEDCWGNPLLVRALYSYDRTASPEDVWIDQNHSDFPEFEFAYRCPVR